MTNALPSQGKKAMKELGRCAKESYSESLLLNLIFFYYYYYSRIGDFIEFSSSWAIVVKVGIYVVHNIIEINGDITNAQVYLCL